MKSMTGYGRGENIREGRKFTVEIKSVNHRYNDITVKLPKTMNYLEDIIRKKLEEYISRGKTDVYVFFETSAKEDVKISLNEALADVYVEQLNNIKRRYDLEDDINLDMITKMPDIMTIEKEEIEHETVLSTLMPALESAIDEFMSLRKREGLTLRDDMLIKLKNIEQLVDSVRERSPKMVMEYKEKFQARLKELMGNTAVDENRLLTEVAIFADKCSIDEEVIRLMSHVNQIRAILNEQEPVGRKLDFLVQEMNREVNTIGSKSNDIDITKVTVELKSEVEKIREQVQNIE